MNQLKRLPTQALLVASLIASSLLSLPASEALALQHPATQWGYTIAGPPTDLKQTPRQKYSNLGAKSRFIVTYNNFPEWAKKEFQAAADVWAANFESSVPIEIDATWSRSASTNVLGSARPGSYFSGFTNAPDSSLWYASALANALANRDLDTRSPEMLIQVNSVASWNTRGDGAPTRNEYDLESVFLHEMGHGLGFLSSSDYDPTFRTGTLSRPTPFDAYAQVIDGRRLSDLPSPSIELGTALTSRLVWSGPLGTAANGGVKPLLYTPARYEDGSSVSHVDEATFSNTGENSAMTPNLDAGEIFHKPGALLLAMMSDLRNKPPLGRAIGLPQPVLNQQALISDAGALITFDLPSNARAAQILNYTIKNLNSGVETTVEKSPAIVKNLKNGVSYSFSIISRNENGVSEAVKTNSLIPQKSWTQYVIDSKSDASRVATNTFNGAPVIAYTDSKNGQLKIAMWNGKRWKRLIVDGNGITGGKTSNPIKSEISLCTSGKGSKQILHIFYSDSVDKDLRYASYNGKNFERQIVDGNAATINQYENPIRTKTSSDVSVSNACVADASGVQVFYRDESQGILLGAVLESQSKDWIYELIDGDRKTDNRTMGDVSFHLDAIQSGKSTYLLYDSVLSMDASRAATSGEIRLAIRSSTDPADWKYQTLDSSGGLISVTGYDVSLGVSAKGLQASWFVASITSNLKPTQLRTTRVTDVPVLTSISTTNHGLPGKWLSTNANNIVFNCEDRLCTYDLGKQSLSLISKEANPDGIQSAWIVQGRDRYLIAGINGQLVGMKP